MSDTTNPEAFVPAAPVPAIIRQPEAPPHDVASFVTWIGKEITASKKHFEPDFKRMHWAMDFASGLMYAGQTSYEDSRYTLNLTLRHIRIRTAQLYAKNPKATYARKPRLDFAVWDERPESLMMAQQAVQQAQAALAGPQVDPATGAVVVMPPPDMGMLAEAQALLADYRQGSLYRAQIERVGRTLELLWDYYLTEPTPRTKGQMKAMVRRAITTGVGYTKLRYQRLMQSAPDSGASIADLTQQLAAIERLRARAANAELQYECDNETERLRQALMSLREQEQVVAREGPMLDFPRSTAIIPDKATRSLDGWIGTGWVAEEFRLPAERVQEIYGIDPKDIAARAQANGQQVSEAEAGTVRFHQFYHLQTRRMYTVAEGWSDYMTAPSAPEVDVEQFFPYYALTLNAVEHEKRVFPPSDVELMRHTQDEYNRSQEARREHRIANRPLYVGVNGAFEKEDTKSLAGYDAHDVVILNNLKEGQNVRELLQPVDKIPIDPQVYEVETLFRDMQRVTGSQEANFGGTSNATATEASIAEGTRLSVTGSESDEIDELLSTVARDFGNVCLAKLPEATVKAIAGPGAVWPEFSRSDLMSEVFLTVEAGASGRPNRDRDMANFERIVPYLLQVPNVDSEALLKHMVRLVDDRIDVSSFIKPGAPSITAMNRIAPPTPGAGPAVPDQQGPAGANNAPNPQVRPPGAQPAYGPSGNTVQ